jgi:HEAT repeat protein
MAPRDLAPGTDWAASIVRAIDDCSAMVLIFSAHANKSKQVLREVQQALDREKPVVPFRVEDVPPEGALRYYLASVHWLDALTSPAELHLAKLAASTAALVQASASHSAKFGTHPQQAAADKISRALTDLESTAAAYRKAGADALGELGPLGAKYVPALVKLFCNDDDYDVASAAADALVNIGPASLPSLVDALRDHSLSGLRRWQSIDVFAGIKPFTPKSVEGLFILGGDPEKYYETALMVIVEYIGKEDTALIPDLMSHLGDNDTAISVSAAHALTNIGPAAIPALREATRNPDKLLAHKATTILNRIRADNHPT